MFRVVVEKRHTSRGRVQSGPGVLGTRLRKSRPAIAGLQGITTSTRRFQRDENSNRLVQHTNNSIGRFIALANTVGPKVQGVESVVRVEAVRRGRPASAHQKPSVFGQLLQRSGQTRREIRNHQTYHDESRLFSAKGK